MIGVPPPEAPRGEPELKIPDCELTDHFRYYLLLRQWFGDPPYHPVGRLQAEHYAALVAEHERDPNLSKMLMRRDEEQNEAHRAHNNGIKAHLGAVLRIPFCLRAFSDFLMNAGGDTQSENHLGATTQVTGWQAEAAMAGGSR
jgi:hypothetical protein